MKTPSDLEGDLLAIFGKIHGYGTRDSVRAALDLCERTSFLLRARLPCIDSTTAAQTTPDVVLAALSIEESKATVVVGAAKGTGLGSLSSEVLFVVCSFAAIPSMVFLRLASKGLHLGMMNAPLDLTASSRLLLNAQPEFIIHRLAPFRRHRLTSTGHGYECGCTASAAMASIGLGACLSAGRRQSAADDHSATAALRNLGFGRSWSVVGIPAAVEASAGRLQDMVAPFSPHVRRLVLGPRAGGALASLARCLQAEALPSLEEVTYRFEALKDAVGRKIGRALYPDLGVLPNLAPLATTLRKLDLCDAGTAAKVPGNMASLESCSLLQHLNLSHNPISGDLSSLQALRLLRTLNLDNTAVGGSVASLASASSLTDLSLFNASAVGGNVSSLGALRPLCVLNLEGTKAHGSLGSLAGLTGLTWLDLGRTWVSGDVGSVAGLSRLVELQLHSTRVEGNVAALAPLVHGGGLQVLDLSHTAVTGKRAQLGTSEQLYHVNLNATSAR